MFRGSTVALITPFKDGKVNEKALKELVEFQIKNGTNGLLPCGTTGESPTLNYEEHERVIEIVIQASAGRVPVMAGTGSNSTAEAVMLTQHAAKAGANAVLSVSPYYNKPSQEGLYRHFKAIAESVNIPVYLYNIQGRTAVNIETDTVARLARDCKNIVGVKEASGSLDQMQAVKMACPPDFILLSGDDALTLPVLSIGGEGIVSVVGNILPKETAQVCSLYFQGKIEEARKLHYQILPVVKAMFIETNPVPVKFAAELMGLCSSDVRLPLCEMSDVKKKQVQNTLEKSGLLKLVHK